MPIIGKPLLVLGSLAGVSLLSAGGYFAASALDSQQAEQPITNVPNSETDSLKAAENDNSVQREEARDGEQQSDLRITSTTAQSNEDPAPAVAEEQQRVENAGDQSEPTPKVQSDQGNTGKPSDAPKPNALASEISEGKGVEATDVSLQGSDTTVINSAASTGGIQLGTESGSTVRSESTLSSNSQHSVEGVGGGSDQKSVEEGVAEEKDGSSHDSGAGTVVGNGSSVNSDNLARNEESSSTPSALPEEVVTSGQQLASAEDSQ